MANSLSIESGALAVPEPDASGVRVYKGIPYAAPPIGRLRWRPPEPAAAWTGVRPTREFGAHSVQGVVWDDIDLSGAATSEDCLHLNVWTPAAPSDGARLPVMVWIHGGGFVVGSGAEPRYDGARLAARGIVVVTVNHRLNALGFLAHPRTHRRIRTSFVRRLRLSRPCRRAAMGSAQRRRFRRRSRQGHDRWRIRRFAGNERAHGLAARQRAFRARHWRERSDVRISKPRARDARGG